MLLNGFRPCKETPFEGRFLLTGRLQNTSAMDLAQNRGRTTIKGFVTSMRILEMYIDLIKINN